jgi:hypothetical protein
MYGSTRAKSCQSVALVLPLQVISEYNRWSNFRDKDMGMTAPLPAGLQQAADYIKAGQLQQAQPLLVRFIKQQPDSADAWYLMSFVVPQPNQQIDCLQRVLRYNPAHRQAQARLVEVMTGQSVEPPQPAAPPSLFAPPPAPWVEESAYTAAPVAEPAPASKPGPGASPATIESPPSASTEFDSLRTKLSEPIKEYRKPRRSYKVLLNLLIIVVLLAAAGTALVLINRPSNDAPVAAAPTVVIPPTETPTETPTPSITPTRFPPTWTPTPPPTARPTRTPTPPPTLDVQQQTQFQAIEQSISDLRGLTVADQPTRYIVPSDRVEPILTNILNTGGLLSALPDRARVLSALGLIDPAYDLQRYTLNLHLDPTGSFYSPWTREMVVTENQVAGLQRQAYALEAARSLLDGAFGFDNSEVYPGCLLNTQGCQAIFALISGDANVAAQQWLRQSATAQDRSQVQATRPPDLALPDELAPLFVIRDANFAREAGTAFVQALYQRGGWARVNQAYDEFPRSTEQILHPEKYLADERPIELAAVPLTDTLGSDWRLIADDVLGEWYTDLLLGANADDQLRIPAEAARSAARGWGGDRLAAYNNVKTNETLLTVGWAWDSVADAREFKLALSAYLDLRFNGARTTLADGDCWQSAQEAACVYTRDRNALWLLASQPDTIDAVKAAYSSFP